MTRNAILDSRFAERLCTADDSMSDESRRTLVFRYATLYQDVYWFDQLESAFTCLELTGNRPSMLPEDLPLILQDVECAMGEYFESLNHVASALHRLLDERLLTRDDVLSCIGSIWDAHACNETVDAFSLREDTVLCNLLASIAGSDCK